MKQLTLTICLALLVTLTACSHAGEKEEHKYGTWHVMTHTPEKGDLLCYAVSSPTKSTAVGDKDGQPYVMITRRVSGRIEVSASSGFAYKKKSPVKIVVDGKAFPLFSKGTVAWAKNDAGDREIINAIKAGKTVEVRAATPSGALSVDTYPAHGFIYAVERIRQLCP